MCFFIFIVFVLDFFVQDESIYAEQATTERRRRPTRHCLAFNSSFCLSSAACISFISCMVWAYPLGPNMDLNCRPLSFSLPALPSPSASFHMARISLSSMSTGSTNTIEAVGDALGVDDLHCASHMSTISSWARSANASRRLSLSNVWLISDGAGGREGIRS